MRRTPDEIASELEARALKMKSDAERRRAIAADATCSWLWDAECALHRIRLATTDDTLREQVTSYAAGLKQLRDARWTELKKGLDGK